jgi:DNA-directed RNA polymerase specialized sigma24 family protein
MRHATKPAAKSAYWQGRSQWDSSEHQHKPQMSRTSTAAQSKNFLAHRVDRLSHSEIAKIHDISVTSVHQRIAKAMLRLTSWMEGW